MPVEQTQGIDVSSSLPVISPQPADDRFPLPVAPFLCERLSFIS
jgi:hypothetical protein